MAEFCGDCPRMGSCEGGIEGIRLVSTVTHGSISDDGRSAMLSVEHGVPQGPTDAVVEYTNADGANSEPFAIHGNSVSETEAQIHEQIVKIQDCSGPIKRKRFFGILTKTVCGSIETQL